jgi:hypothetical protein
MLDGKKNPPRENTKSGIVQHVRVEKNRERYEENVYSSLHSPGPLKKKKKNLWWRRMAAIARNTR